MCLGYILINGDSEIRFSIKSTAPFHENISESQLFFAVIMGNYCSANSDPEPLRTQIDKVWADMMRGRGSESMERMQCWGLILTDDKLARLIGDSDMDRGREILRALKDLSASSGSRSSRIDATGFVEIFDDELLAAARTKVAVHYEIREKLEAMWKELVGQGLHVHVDRSRCWSLVLADDELAYLLGDSDVSKGREVLRILVVQSRPPQDTEDEWGVELPEFMRLCNPDILALARKSAGFSNPVPPLPVNWQRKRPSRKIRGALSSAESLDEFFPKPKQKKALRAVSQSKSPEVEDI